MAIGFQSRLATLSLLALHLVVATAGCKRNHPEESLSERHQESEPVEYTAIVVRTVEQDGKTDVTATRIARSGALFREEWTDGGETYAIIWRPDKGRSYFLSLGKKEYSETEWNDSNTPSSELSGTEPSLGLANSNPGVEMQRNSPANHAELPKAGGRFEGVVSPTSTVKERLADETIEGHDCQVWQETMFFSDGHSERTKVYRAADLSGLAIRVLNETTGQAGMLRVTTERRDVSTRVSADEFNVPPGFKKLSPN
jgi:hypothetical protein